MELTGIILAGGKSTRMGTDKALIKIGNHNLLEIAIQICKPVCKSIIISSNNPEHAKFGYTLVADEIPDCGPISGILSCLKKSETDWNFIISVDTPFVTSDFITFLVAQAENFDAVIPDNAGYKEPLVALYNKKCLPIIEEQIARQQYKIHYLISLLNSRYINVNKWEGYLPKLFKNLNRPEDIQMQNKIL